MPYYAPPAAQSGTYVPLSTVTTKGDLIAATGNAAVARKAVGTDGQVLAADSTQTNGVAWVTRGDPLAIAEFPSGVLAETVPRRLVLGTNSFTPTSGQMYFCGMWLAKGAVVGHINYFTGSTAAVSPTHWWFALWDNSGNMLAVTADQTTTALAGFTKASLAIATISSGASATFTTTYSGLHYVTWMMTATTMPTLILGTSAFAATSGPVFVDTPLCSFNAGGAQTTPPSFPKSVTPANPWYGSMYAQVAT